MKKIITLLILASMALTGISCGSEGGENAGQEEVIKDVSVKDVCAAVETEFGENYLPNMELDAEMLDSVYGIKPEWCEEFYAKQPMIGFHVDILIGVKATEGNADNVEKAMNDYATYTKENSMNYPANAEKVKTVRVHRKGDYVFYILLGFSEEMMDADEQTQFDFYTGEQERAIKVIDAQLVG